MRLFLFLALALPAAAQPIDLSGAWRFQNGDDMRWAAPDFDDSGWSIVQLPLQAARPVGWNWWRRSASVKEMGLVLTLGTMARSYEVYVNGVKIGEAGHLGAAHQQFTMPRAFDLQAGTADRLVIAIRAWSPVVNWGSATHLVDNGPYWLTYPSHAVDAVNAAKATVRIAATPTLVIAIAQLILGTLVLICWLAIPRKREMLWFSGFQMTSAMFNASIYFFVVNGIGFSSYFLSVDYAFLLAATSIIFAPSRLIPPGHSPFDWKLASAAGGAWLLVMLVAPDNAYLLLLIFPWWWALLAFVRGNLEQRQLSIPVLAFSTVVYSAAASRYFPGWPLPTMVQAAGFAIYFPALVNLVATFSMVILLLRSMGADQREKFRLAAEVHAARSVQQLLLASSDSHRDFRVDTSYLPASEVGGDFYCAQEADGGRSLTIVLGDVSGKGLKAAMVVSMIVGVLRREAERSPAQILSALNGVLNGALGGGFVTCCVIRCDPGGQLTAANAGHLSPYCGGCELELEAGLPLGLDASIAYMESRHTLAEGEQLTMISDGVLEAATANGQLFGFERTLEISGKSAGDIAEAARAWGQNDDITVVTVRRVK